MAGGGNDLNAVVCSDYTGSIVTQKTYKSIVGEYYIVTHYSY